MNQTLIDLKNIIYQVNDLDMAQAVLGWDQQTYMPSGGAVDRGNQLSTLASLRHEIFTQPRTRESLEKLVEEAKGWDPDSDDACLLRVVNRAYRKAIKVTPAWVAEFTRVITLAHNAWEEAKENNHFEVFKPFLSQIVLLRQEYSSFYAPYEHVYDPQLDDFEPGMRTEEIKAIFGELRPVQVALIREIASQPQVDNDFLIGNFPIEGQREFGSQVITRFGYDWERGRLDMSVHPFSTSFGLGDVRITTRYDENNISGAIFGMFHECGHALYDQGCNPALQRTPLCTGASMAIHESQSRMWENLVGRSLPFWEYYYPMLQARFPQQLGHIDLTKFYRGVNQVAPSLIRVASDEATYNLHIMLRLELEIALLEGSLQVEDLPEAWNEKMRDYLGIMPPDDSHGVLQDIHWSGGGFGYFPTYALGNLVAAQLWECIHKDIPGLEDSFRRGDFSSLLEWLRQNVHRHGAKYEPQELVSRITGSKIQAQPYINYLRKKFGQIYGLDS